MVVSSSLCYNSRNSHTCGLIVYKDEHESSPTILLHKRQYNTNREEKREPPYVLTLVLTLILHRFLGELGVPVHQWQPGAAQPALRAGLLLQPADHEHWELSPLADPCWNCGSWAFPCNTGNNTWVEGVHLRSFSPGWKHHRTRNCAAWGAVERGEVLSQALLIGVGKKIDSRGFFSPLLSAFLKVNIWKR